MRYHVISLRCRQGTKGPERMGELIMRIPSAEEMRRNEELSDKRYDGKVASETEKLDDLVSQVRKAIETGEIKGTLLLSKISKVTGCTPDTAEKIKSIIKGE